MRSHWLRFGLVANPLPLFLQRSLLLTSFRWSARRLSSSASTRAFSHAQSPLVSGNADTESASQRRKRATASTLIEPPASDFNLTTDQMRNVILKTKSAVDSDRLDEYCVWQRSLKHHRAPSETSDFAMLFGQSLKLAPANEEIAVLDVSPAIIASLYYEKVLLVRPRRSGKSTFAQLWLEYWRGNKKLFQQLVIPTDDMPEPKQMVCVNLDFSATPLGDFIVNLLHELNEALTTAGIEEQISSEPQPLDASTVVMYFVSILNLKGKKAALVIDGYDSFVLNAKDETERTHAQRETQSFFWALKASSEEIDQVLVTGTTHLSVDMFLVDVTYDLKWATALGYTWSNISHLFEQQLKELASLYSMTSEELRFAIEFWYDGYSFSPLSGWKVFSVWAINQLMEQGTFRSHLSSTATKAHTGFSRGELLYLLSDKAQSTEVGYDSFEAISWWCYGQADSLVSTQATLLRAGMLTFDGGYSEQEPLVLKAPNEVARFAIYNVLVALSKPLPALDISSAIGKGAILEAIQLMQPELQAVAAERSQWMRIFYSHTEPHEIHLKHACSALLHMVQVQFPCSLKWFVETDLKTVPQSGQLPRSDFILLHCSADCHIIKFARFDTDDGTHLAHLKLLLEKLEQSLTDKPVGQQATFSAIVWNTRGELVCGVGPLDEQIAVKLIDARTKLGRKGSSFAAFVAKASAIRWSHDGKTWSSEIPSPKARRKRSSSVMKARATNRG